MSSVNSTAGNPLDFEKLLSAVPEPTKDDAKSAGFETADLAISSIGVYEFNRNLTDDQVEVFMHELAADNFDLLHPIVVVPDEREGRSWTVFAGERRYRAFKMAGRATIPAIIRRDLTPRQMRSKNIRENVQRLDEPVNSLAKRYKAYCDEFVVSQKEAAKEFGLRESIFSDLVKYLYLIDEIPLVKEIFEGGVTDRIFLKHLIRIHQSSESAAKSIVAFGRANRCLNRDLVEAAVDFDIHGDVEASCRQWLLDYQEVKALAAEKKSKKSKPQKDTQTDQRSGEEQLALTISDESGTGFNSYLNELDEFKDEDPDGQKAPVTEMKQEEKAQVEQEQEQNPDTTEQSSEKLDANSQPGQMKKRPLSSCEIMVVYQGSNYFLELSYVSLDESKIVLRNLAGDYISVPPQEVQIQYVS